MAGSKCSPPGDAPIGASAGFEFAPIGASAGFDPAVSPPARAEHRSASAASAANRT
jgi:hypothetical protein